MPDGHSASLQRCADDPPALRLVDTGVGVGCNVTCRCDRTVVVEHRRRKGDPEPVDSDVDPRRIAEDRDVEGLHAVWEPRDCFEVRAGWCAADGDDNVFRLLVALCLFLLGGCSWTPHTNESPGSNATNSDSGRTLDWIVRSFLQETRPPSATVAVERRGEALLVEACVGRLRRQAFGASP